ncbi:MAG TPA: hypothetical protein VFE27_24240 [Acidobacteriaceae bacterium]|jgi:hypothetical protein|nr:hypothetical protein [Acidobacteriaceae bacterium]
MHTKPPWEVVKFSAPLGGWSGARFVVRAPDAPGGIALIIGGLGEAEEGANAQAIAKAGMLARPAMGAALRSIVLDYARFSDHVETWEDVLTEDKITIEEVLAFVLEL